jgi:uncharacterized membrane protein YdbT with pleckstrin-like domain
MDQSTEWETGAPRPKGAMETGPGDEVVLFSAVPAAMPSVWLRWLITLGLYEIWRRRTKFIVTNRRVVWRQGLINRSERSIPISRIQDVTTHKGLLAGWVELSSAGGTTGVETMGPVWNASVDRMAQAIDSLLR